MEQIRLGRTGLHVSRLCLGMMSYGNDSDRPWVLDESAAEPIIRAAVEGGITFFDTADVYSGGASEVATGRLVPQAPVARRGRHRDQGPRADDAGPNGARALAQAHPLGHRRVAAAPRDGPRRPLPDPPLGPGTPIEETMEALHDIVRAGKARYIGASSMYAWQFAKAQRVAERHGWTPFVSMQNHYNLLYREEEREMIPQCLDQGVGVLPWSPLARGWLAGTRTRDGERPTTRANTDAFQDQLYGRPEDFDVIERLVEVAADRGAPPAQVALAWLLQQPGVTAPIVGATKPATSRTRSPPPSSRSPRTRSNGSRSPTGPTPYSDTDGDATPRAATRLARAGIIYGR